MDTEPFCVTFENEPFCVTFETFSVTFETFCVTFETLCALNACVTSSHVTAVANTWHDVEHLNPDVRGNPSRPRRVHQLIREEGVHPQKGGSAYRVFRVWVLGRSAHPQKRSKAPGSVACGG